MQTLIDSVMDQARKAERQAKIVQECSEEIGFELGNAMRLLYGDFNNHGVNAKVLSKGK